MSDQQPHVELKKIFLRIPDPRGQGADFELLQRWEGTVTSTPPYDESFIAILEDLTHSDCPDEEVEFSLHEVDPDDKKLLAPGAIFYWTIGYAKNVYGQIRRVSFLRFRRLPAWGKRELDRGAERARALGVLLPESNIETDVV